MTAQKIVLITGASRGIGAATARRFHAERAAVVMSGRRKAKLADVGQSFGESDRTTRRPDLHIAH